ncbi:hypothetical protein AGMMS50262_11960 [Bacteroidia bacterium]|nr:hypothetical protein AGMMS50262_11960 [Bacteroidia bacterium]
MTAFSICIPVYNCAISTLVEELHKQAVETRHPFEILLMDDCSSQYREENRRLQELSQVSYIEWQENIGRAKIRNRLAQTAQYPYLIFMDCDTKVENSSYIQNYLAALPAEVVVGGYAYAPVPPEHRYELRWSYGRNREEIPAHVRNLHPNKSFSTFNFLIRKEVFNTVQFDETISGYGHEDTLFGWALKKQSIPIKHIDNPLLHQSLDDTGTFLSKTENSVKNLWRIYQSVPQKDDLAQDITLLKYYLRLKKYHLTFLISVVTPLLQPLALRNLRSDRPKMFCFDLYKLMIINKIANQYASL